MCPPFFYLPPVRPPLPAEKFSPRGSPPPASPFNSTRRCPMVKRTSGRSSSFHTDNGDFRPSRKWTHQPDPKRQHHSPCRPRTSGHRLSCLRCPLSLLGTWHSSATPECRW